MYQAGEYGRGFQQQRRDIIVDQHARNIEPADVLQLRRSECTPEPPN